MSSGESLSLGQMIYRKRKKSLTTAMQEVLDVIGANDPDQLLAIFENTIYKIFNSEQERFITNLVTIVTTENESTINIFEKIKDRLASSQIVDEKVTYPTLSQLQCDLGGIRAIVLSKFTSFIASLKDAKREITDRYEAQIDHLSVKNQKLKTRLKTCKLKVKESTEMLERTQEKLLRMNEQLALFRAQESKDRIPELEQQLVEVTKVTNKQQKVITKLQKQDLISKSEVKQLREKVALLEAENKLTKSSISLSDLDVTSYDRLKEEQEEMIQSLREENEQLTRSLDEVKSQVESEIRLQNDIDQVMMISEMRKQKADKLEKITKDLTARLKRSVHELEEAHSELDVLRSVNETNVKLEKELEKAKEENTDMNESLATLCEKSFSLQEMVTEKDKLIEKLRNMDKSNRTQIRHLHAEIAQMQGERKDVQNKLHLIEKSGRLEEQERQIEEQAKNIEELSVMVNNMKEYTEELQEMIEDQNRKISELCESGNSQRAALTQSETDIEGLVKMLRDISREKETLIGNNEEVMKTTTERIQNLSQELENARIENSELYENYIRIQKSLADSAVSIEELQSDNNKMRSIIIQQQKEINNYLAPLRTENENLRVSIAKLKEQKAQLNNELINKESDLTRALSKAQRKVATLELSVRDLRDKRNSDQREFKKMKSEIEAKNKQVQETEEETSILQKLSNVLGVEQRFMLDKVEDLVQKRSEIKELETANAQLSDKISDLTENSFSTQSRLNELENQRSNLTTRVEELEAQVTTERSEKETVQACFEDLTADVSSLKSVIQFTDIRSLRDVIRANDIKRSELMNELLDTKTTVKSLEMVIEKLKSEGDAKSLMLEKSSSELEKSYQQIYEIRKSLSDIQKESASQIKNLDLSNHTMKEQLDQMLAVVSELHEYVEFQSIEDLAFVVKMTLENHKNETDRLTSQLSCEQHLLKEEKSLREGYLDQLKKAKQALEDQDNANRVLRRLNSQTEKELDGVRSTLSEKEQMIDNLESNLRKIVKFSALSDIPGLIQELKKTLADLTTKNKNMSKSLIDTEINSTKLTKQLATTELKLVNLMKQRRHESDERRLEEERNEQFFGVSSMSELRSVWESLNQELTLLKDSSAKYSSEAAMHKRVINGITSILGEGDKIDVVSAVRNLKSRYETANMDLSAGQEQLSEIFRAFNTLNLPIDEVTWPLTNDVMKEIMKSVNEMNQFKDDHANIGVVVKHACTLGYEGSDVEEALEFIQRVVSERQNQLKEVTIALSDLKRIQDEMNMKSETFKQKSEESHRNLRERVRDLQEQLEVLNQVKDNLIAMKSGQNYDSEFLKANLSEYEVEQLEL